MGKMLCWLHCCIPKSLYELNAIADGAEVVLLGCKHGLQVPGQLSGVDLWSGELPFAVGQSLFSLQT